MSRVRKICGKSQIVKRRSLNLLAVVSLLLCVATAVAWCVSYRHTFGIIGPLHGRRVGAGVERGSVLGVCHVDPAYHPPKEWERIWESHNEEPLDDVADCHGLGFGLAWKSELKLAYVPLWFVEVGFICCSVLLVYRSRRIKRPGFCSKCGYDLRATPDRCPECGTVPT
jgi:hypothetical protein